MLSENTRHQRYELLKKWLNTFLPYEHIAQIAGDASFRRYFRVNYSDKTFIAMDAPPELEDSHAFLAMASVFQQAGLCVPHVIRADLSLGFLLISDLGDDLYFHILNQKNAGNLYGCAIEKLHVIQSCFKEKNAHFPIFSHDLFMEELTNFKIWYLETHLQLVLSEEDEKLLADTFSLLITSALEQPQVCVHRDYHSRNLLVLPENELGIIDFQDALWGPITYDLVSLIRDCYIVWPDEQVKQWTKKYYTDAKALGRLKNVSYHQFKRWFDWMGVVRHLKAIFIFARKWHRDKNKDYLNDIPTALQYVLDVTKEYPDLSKFREFLREIKKC